MRIALAGLVATLAAVTAPAARAQECGFSPGFFEEPPALVVEAGPVREALDRGDYAEVAALARDRIEVDAIQRDLKTHRWRAPAFGEADVRTALAIAVVRTDGVEGPRGKTANAKQQKKNLAWAADVLGLAFGASVGDPVVGTWYGEAALKAGRRSEASRVLEDLAGADLIVSPEGWAALAQLRAVDEDEAGTQAARLRCEAMAANLSICTPAARGKVARS